MKYVMGIDIGTSGTKTLIADFDGRLIALSHENYEVSIPQAGWSEQDPEIWWKAVVRTIRDALHRSGIDPGFIAGIGLSGQMHGLVPLDQGRRVVRPAILWSDQRSERQIQDICGLIGRKKLIDTTLNAPSTGFLCLSLLWMKEMEPENFKNTALVLLPKDYVRFRLTGRIGTELTDASGTLVFDTAKQQWDHDLMEKLGFPERLFPEVHRSADISGEIHSEASLETGLKRGTLIVYGGGDQSMQMVGNGIIHPGMASSNIGTASQISTPVTFAIHDSEARTNTICHADPSLWTIMGAGLNGGSVLKWLKNKILCTESYEQLSEISGRISPGADGIVFLPYLSGERTPHFDPHAKGLFIGLGLHHHSGHLVRSVMEGVVFALKDSLSIIESLGISVDKVIASGGGANSRTWLQIQADVFGRSIYTTDSKEQACLGAAIMAGIGTDQFSGLEEACGRMIRIRSDVTEPHPHYVRMYEEYYEIYKELYRVNKPLFLKLDAVHTKI